MWQNRMCKTRGRCFEKEVNAYSNGMTSPAPFIAAELKKLKI